MGRRLSKAELPHGRAAAAGFAGSAAATIFVGAFLLFLVQPIIGKTILPWFGGSPAVWTTCLLFFQLLLLGGYAYADRLAHWGPPSRQALIHCGLLLLALLTLPITPSAGWKPVDGSQPTVRILALLTVCVGLPYFLLSATSPLIQTWFARLHPERSPYRLYALSNIGSLGALLLYPVLVEPALPTSLQGLLWSLAFVLFAVACGWLAWQLLQALGKAPGAVASAAPPPEPNGDAPAARPSWRDRGLWLALPALASLMLLAVTNHLCQDVAVVPFLWLAPLGLYLLSFIICFDREAWYVRRWFALAAFLGIVLASDITLSPYFDSFCRDWNWPFPDLRHNMVLVAGVHLALFFLLSMVCHGEVVRRKPASRYLTSFYLSVASGGALGGLLVAVVCPQLFSSFLELPLGLLAGSVLTIWVFLRDGYPRWLSGATLLLKAAAAMAGATLLGLVVWAQWEVWDREPCLVLARNFYGVLSVRERHEGDPDIHGWALYHGSTLHGYQYADQSARAAPTTYYVERSGIGRTLRNLHPEQPRRVGVVGLGAGTLAAYGQAGDQFRFYELNPLVIRVAQEYFTFLSDSAAEVRLIEGDARLSLEREVDEDLEPLDLLVLDAFSGDAIPVHLLTREAFEVYLRRLKPGGVLAIHTSNRYLDLMQVVVGLARVCELDCGVVTLGEYPNLSIAPSEWMLLSRDRTFLAGPALRDEAVRPNLGDDLPIWTDQYNNLWQILRRPTWLRE